MSGIHHNLRARLVTVTPTVSHYADAVTQCLHRYYGTQDLHFITGSCYHRQPKLGTPERRDLLVRILEETRRKYRFVVDGYVVMPEHFHLLITEPELGDPGVVMKVVKERFARHINKDLSGAHEPVWQKRFYDFNVWTARKRVEKIHYMHLNPVSRGLVERPDQWIWSSFRAYHDGETEPVRVRFQEWPLEIRRCSVQAFGRR